MNPWYNAAFYTIPIHILYTYYDEMRDIPPMAKPEGTPEGKGVYLTVYPELSPHTDSISISESKS